MTKQSDFGVLLQRLLQHRALDLRQLSRATSVSELELQAVLDGMAPESSLLRQLAPSLNLQVADLFVMAELPVPDDLTPFDANARSTIDELVKHSLRLQKGQIRRVRAFAQSLPQRVRIEQPPPSPVYEQYPPSPGAMIVRMLHNRNLDWVTSARILFRLTGIGPLSAATIGSIGRGHKALSSELLSGVAAVLAIPADDLAAAIEIDVTHKSLSVNPVTADVAELIWEVRRLAADQVRCVCDAAKREFPN